MKKKYRIIIAVVILLVLFVPIPRGTAEDGGTRVYRAVTYEIVVWNRLDSAVDGGVYKKTEVFWFPDNFKSLDELWKKEHVKSSK